MAKTVNQGYKKTLSGSIGAGMGSLFSPGGRKYYILEHKVTSKYHRAGENQEIIVDNIELGRDPHCQVRFDESFKTVSRKHAAIVKDGDMWKLVQLSKTNTTFLNGRPVKDEWYLQNGDEIQLSVNGPKLGFILPTGKKSTVGSIGLTRRLSLFRQQALRPYKTALTAMSIVLLLAVGGLVTWNLMLRDDLSKQSSLIADQALENKNNKQVMDSLRNQLADANQQLDDYQQRLDSISAVAKKAMSMAKRKVSSGTVNSSVDISRCIPHVYFLQFGIFNNDELIAGPWIGTGFMLDGGYFVTAQHCAIPWSKVGLARNSSGDIVIDPDSEETVLNALCNTMDLNVKMICQSSNDEFIIEYSTQNIPFKTGNAIAQEGKLQLGEGTYLYRVYDLPSKNDWAVLKTNKSSGLPYEGNLSKNLPIQTPLHYLGFPHGEGSEGTISPVYSQGLVGQDHLTSDGVILSSNANTDGGHSGGPVFVLTNDNQYKVVGIHVGVRGSNDTKGIVVPIGNFM